MKKLIYVFAALLILGISGCKDPNKPTPKLWNDADTDTVAIMPDTTVYGICGEGSAMHTLELITSQGDTLLLNVDNDSVSSLKGGMSIGDHFAVILQKGSDEDESDKAALAINLTTLMGKWTALDKTFELQEGGAVVSTVVEPHPLTEWKIFNGHLVLSADTFDIYELGADSLYLENRDGIFVYKRMK